MTGTMNLTQSASMHEALENDLKKLHPGVSPERRWLTVALKIRNNIPGETPEGFLIIKSYVRKFKKSRFADELKTGKQICKRYNELRKRMRLRRQAVLKSADCDNFSTNVESLPESKTQVKGLLESRADRNFKISALIFLCVGVGVGSFFPLALMLLVVPFGYGFHRFEKSAWWREKVESILD